MNEHELNLDHFLLYDVANYPAGQIVALQGQFDKVRERVKLTALEAFANWVSKNGESVYDKNAHLAWYNIYDPAPDPMRLVYYDNQFGEQKAIIGRAIALLTPAWKVEEGSSFPEGLDHYKVYQVLDASQVEKSVTLEDQFGACDTPVGPPYAFAVPVIKWYEGEAHEIRNPDAHLVFYRIRPKSVDQQRLVYDQFGKRYLQFFRTVLLGVPTVKSEWQPYD